MDDIELKNIQLHFPSTRSLSRDDSSAQEEVVETDRGNLVVAVQGSRNKPAILTYHDLGLNCEFYFIQLLLIFYSYCDFKFLNFFSRMKFCQTHLKQLFNNSIASCTQIFNKLLSFFLFLFFIFVFV